MKTFPGSFEQAGMRWLELDTSGRLRNFTPEFRPDVIRLARDSVDLAGAFGYCGA